MNASSRSSDVAIWRKGDTGSGWSPKRRDRNALGEQVKTALRLPLRFGASCAAHERCDSRENEKHTILRLVVVRTCPWRWVI